MIRFTIAILSVLCFSAIQAVAAPCIMICQTEVKVKQLSSSSINKKSSHCQNKANKNSSRPFKCNSKNCLTDVNSITHIDKMARDILIPDILPNLTAVKSDFKLSLALSPYSLKPPTGLQSVFTRSQSVYFLIQRILI